MDLYRTVDAAFERGRSGDSEESRRLEADCELVMNEFHKGNNRIPLSIIHTNGCTCVEDIGWVARIRNRINEHLADANQKVRCSIPSSHRARATSFMFAIPEME